MLQKSKAFFVVDGQWGSSGKGAAVAYLTSQLCEAGQMFDVVTANNGAQSGHTSVHRGKTRVAFHLPTAPLISAEYGKHPLVYLNGGSIIDPDVLAREINEFLPKNLQIHPNAAIITTECKKAESRDDSAQTKIASTRKGVGEALARKILRSGVTARNEPSVAPFVQEYDLNTMLDHGSSVLVEIPQGIGLSIDGPFYPHCTSRNCNLIQAMADAAIHPQFYGGSMLVLRSYPIRVGSINDLKTGVQLGYSGDCYPDQKEIQWSDLGVNPEITTVTKRVRRVFTFSRMQARHAMTLTRPSHVQLTFCDYPGYANYVRNIRDYIYECAKDLNMERPTIIYQYGPTTDDCYPEMK